MTEWTIPTELRPCRDCAVEPGELHDPGCCIERCKLCGFQAIGCDCPDPTTGEYASTFDATFGDWKSTTWRGYHPGILELSEGLAADPNELDYKHRFGELRWDPEQERLVKP